MKKIIVTVFAAIVAFSNVTTVFAANYSCDTVEESFFTPTVGTENGSDETQTGTGASSSTDSTDTKVDVVPTPTPVDPIPTPSEDSGSTGSDSGSDQTVPETPAPTDSTASGSETIGSWTGSIGTVDNSVNSIYVPITETTDNPSLNANCATGDGVPVSVKENWAYSLDEAAKQITLTAYIGTAKAVVVPSTVKVGEDKYSVLVANRLFYGNKSITSVTFSPQVRTVKGSLFKMFFGCSNLKTVRNLPWDATYIRRAFMGCKKLTSVTLPESVINADYAFSGCSSLKTVKFSGNNLSKAYKVFNGCKNLKSVSGITKKQASKIKGFFDGVKKSIVK